MWWIVHETNSWCLYLQIILSTNIAESSVTVPDVKYGGFLLLHQPSEFLRSSYSEKYKLCIIFCYAVIDFCLVRQLVCDKETNYRSLQINWASKTSCNQRRGTAHVGWCSVGQIYCKGAHSLWVFLNAFYWRLFLCILPGRAGRVSKGFCYRLVSRHFWENEIPDFTIPEMLVSEQ